VESSANVGIKSVRWVLGDPAPCYSLAIAPVIRVLSLLWTSQQVTLGGMNSCLTYLPSPKDPSLYSLPNLDLYLEVFPHLVFIILRERGRIAGVTSTAAEELLVRGGPPFPLPPSTNAAPVEPFRAVCQGVGPFAGDCPDAGTLEVDKRLALGARVLDVLVEGAGELFVAEDLVHVLLERPSVMVPKP